jgi:hypothetical protein
MAVDGGTWDCGVCHATIAIIEPPPQCERSDSSPFVVRAVPLKGGVSKLESFFLLWHLTDAAVHIGWRQLDSSVSRGILVCRLTSFGAPMSIAARATAEPAASIVNVRSPSERERPRFGTAWRRDVPRRSDGAAGADSERGHGLRSFDAL